MADVSTQGDSGLGGGLGAKPWPCFPGAMEACRSCLWRIAAATGTHGLGLIHWPRRPRLLQGSKPFQIWMAILAMHIESLLLKYYLHSRAKSFLKTGLSYQIKLLLNDLKPKLHCCKTWYLLFPPKRIWVSLQWNSFTLLERKSKPYWIRHRFTPRPNSFSIQ